MYLMVLTMSKVKVKQDLVGKRFGRLTVVEQAEDYVISSGKRCAQWICRCDCGNEHIVRGYSLKNGDTKSCGCLAREKTVERNKKHNTYDLSGDYGIGRTVNGKEFYFDLEDYEKIKNHYWYFNSQGYVVAHDAIKKNKIRLHRLVMGFPDMSYDVDHIHGKDTKNDNRKSNLRICLHQENMMNIGIRNNNASGVTGVCWDNTRKKWMAYITYKDNKFHKRFDNFEDAVNQRQKWKNEYFGEFGYKNDNN